MRKDEIREISLSEELYNDEWHELIVQENSLIKLIKLNKKQN